MIYIIMKNENKTMKNENKAMKNENKEKEFFFKKSFSLKALLFFFL